MKYQLPLILFDPECPLCTRFKQGLEYLDKSLHFESARNDDEVKNVGVEWAIAQSQELIKAKVPCLHFYSMGKSTAIQQVASKLF